MGLRIRERDKVKREVEEEEEEGGDISYRDRSEAKCIINRSKSTQKLRY